MILVASDSSAPESLASWAPASRPFVGAAASNAVPQSTSSAVDNPQVAAPISPSRMRRVDLDAP
jgi:hypothetical protein